MEETNAIITQLRKLQPAFDDLQRIEVFIWIDFFMFLFRIFVFLIKQLQNEIANEQKTLDSYEQTSALNVEKAESKKKKKRNTFKY